MKTCTVIEMCGARISRMIDFSPAPQSRNATFLEHTFEPRDHVTDRVSRVGTVASCISSFRGAESPGKTPAGAASDLEGKAVTGTSSTLGSSLKEARARRARADAGSSADARDLERSDIDALIGRDYIGLRLLIFRRVGDTQVAADLLNDAICIAWEKYCEGQIARPEQIAGFVFQVAMNLLRNRRRSIGERPERRTDADLIDALPANDAQVDLDVGDRVTDQVLRILRSMDSARDRTVLVRFYLDEDDKDVICRDLRLSPSQFAKVLHRARRRLRELLESQGLKGSDLFSWFLI
jgi:RNA polymerase sigma-70 factor, ECF subfamily